MRLNTEHQNQTPLIPADNKRRIDDRSREHEELSDNGSEHGSDRSDSSRHIKTEARKSFRHVMAAPNPEKFAGDKKAYHLWKTALESEVDHFVDEMTPEMWIRLLTARTRLQAYTIVQENKEAQEILGAQETVNRIWKAFDRRYADDRNPGRDFLSSLISGPPIQTSDPTSFWSFVDRCSLAAEAMKRDEVVRSTLALPHNLEAVAARLGEDELREWRRFRKMTLNEDKPVDFQTFCKWVEVRVSATPVESRAKSTPVRQNTYQQTQNGSPQYQGRREQYNRYKNEAQRQPQSTPGAPAYCAWCRENNQQARHSTKDCKQFKEASTADQWMALERRNVCYLCLIGSHRTMDCPELTDQTRCTKCHFSHHTSIKCRPTSQQPQRTRSGVVSRISTDTSVNYSRTVPVEVTHPNAERPMRGFAIIDDQSSITMLHPSAMEIMGLQQENLESVTLATTTVHGISAPERYPIVKGIQVKGMNALNRHRMEMPETYLHRSLDNFQLEVPTRDQVRQMHGLEHLADKFLNNHTDLKPIMLIGRDCIRAQRQYQTVSKDGRLIASETPLGWCIMGQNPNHPPHNNPMGRTSPPSNQYRKRRSAEAINRRRTDRHRQEGQTSRSNTSQIRPHRDERHNSTNF